MQLIVCERTMSDRASRMCDQKHHVKRSRKAYDRSTTTPKRSSAAPKRSRKAHDRSTTAPKRSVAAPDRSTITPKRSTTRPNRSTLHLRRFIIEDDRQILSLIGP